MQRQNSFRPLHGILFAALTAVSAEFILRPSLRTADLIPGVGRAVLSFLVLFTLFRFAYLNLKGFKPATKDVFAILLTLIGSVSLVSLGQVLAIGVTTYLNSSLPRSSYAHISAESFSFAIPFATGALLLHAVLGSTVALIFGISLTLLLGLYFPAQPLLASYAFTTTIVACLSLSHFRSRSAYTKAGLKVALVAFPFALATVVIEGDLSAADITIRLFSSLIGCLLCSILAAGIIPALEAVGGYVTDMRLLEIGTLDHPLLKELSIQAPGTWNHSMVMGMMVESAADAIGANTVLSRVGAYFHDIGKTKKPLYFVENQLGGENRHDKLSPSMSALIIRSHVKDGIEMAKQYKLPLSIEDMIGQHHGTSRIEYFYDKACKEAEGAADVSPSVPVEESLYTYPGPKPQTREAGLLMLADGIEAAARTLSDLSLDRIQGMVQKMINKVFASGELNECDLTLQDLHQIAKCYTRVLNGIYHQRIAYAEPAEKVNSKEVEEAGENTVVDGAAIKEMDGASAAKKQKGGTEERGSKEDSKEDLKRLGL